MSTLPPGPRMPAALQLWHWIRRPMEFMDDCRRDYGDTFTIRLLNIGTMVLFTKPEDIKQVFTGDTDSLRAGEAQADLAPLVGKHSVLVLDGAKHLRERRLMMPPFHGERMQAYATLMREITDASIDSWPLHEPFALHHYLQKLTLRVILKAIFGFEDGPRLDEFTAAVTRTVDAAMSPFVILPMFQMRLGGHSPWARFLEIEVHADKLLFAEIARRRASADIEGRTDILSILLQARYEDGSPMTDQELRDELFTLIVAGHETSATSLAWAFERLLTHPSAFASARAELERVVGNGPLEPEHLPRLEYIDAVLKETLRLRPILPIVVRDVHSPVTIGGWTLPAGVRAAPCIYLAQRDPKSYPDAETFSPERFLGARIDPYSWLPFGGGVRRCLGMAFAQYEMKIVLAATLLRARMHLADGGPARVTRRAITLVPSGGTRVVLDGRAARRAKPAAAVTNVAVRPADQN